MKFDRDSINKQTVFARLQIKDMAQRLERLLGDPNKDARIRQFRCRLCFYRGRICGQAFTEFTCQKCGVTKEHHNTCVPKLCNVCANELLVCAECGADINLEDR